LAKGYGVMKAKLKNWWDFQKEDLSRRIRSYPKLRSFLLFFTFIGLTVSLVLTRERSQFLPMLFWDKQVLAFLTPFKTPLTVSFFELITFLGSDVFISLAFFALALFLALKRRKRAAAAALLSYLGSLSFLFFFKNFFGRLRPFGCLAGADCLSYPSGHTTLSVYFYGLLSYLIWRFLPVSLKAFIMIAALLLVLTLLILASRLFLDAHYPSDLLGGIFLGGSWLTAAILLIDILY
jgi:undecaprenyl-diphosphatase